MKQPIKPKKPYKPSIPIAPSEINNIDLCFASVLFNSIGKGVMVLDSILEMFKKERADFVEQIKEKYNPIKIIDNDQIYISCEDNDDYYNNYIMAINHLFSIEVENKNYQENLVSYSKNKKKD